MQKCKSNPNPNPEFPIYGLLDPGANPNSIPNPNPNPKDYLTRVRPLSDINDEMAMDIDEFVDGILLMSACKASQPLPLYPTLNLNHYPFTQP